MLKPPINELIAKAGNRYALVIATSKRARNIIDGESPLLEIDSIKPVTIATNEVYEDKIEIIKPNECEIE